MDCREEMTETVQLIPRSEEGDAESAAEDSREFDAKQNLFITGPRKRKMLKQSKFLSSSLTLRINRLT
jgi:hypothetical protein